jgi:energy-coupling factor transporter ATP-binding protein EcfA2
MPRIGKLHVMGYRGITKEVNLLLEGKSLILFGENGTGKSSFVEAIEKLFTGKISSLDGRAQGLSSSKHGPSIKVPDSGTEIEVTFDDGTIFNLDSSLESLPNHIQSYLRAAGQPLFILRRAQILELIEREPRKRGDFLQPFLPLSEWNEIEGALKQSSDMANQRAQESKQALQRVIGELSNLLELPSQSTPFTEEVFIEHINMHLSKHSFTPVSTPQGIQEALHSVEQKLSSFGDISAHITFHNLAGQIDAITPSLQIDWLAAFLKEIRELQSREQAQAHLFFEEVLQKGLQWIEQARLDDCPLCEQPIDRLVTAERIQNRLGEMEKLIMARRNVDKIRHGATSNLEDLTQKLTDIESTASIVGRKEIIDLTTELRGWVQKAFETLSPQVSDIKIQEVLETLESWPSYNFSVRLSEILHELKGILSAIPTPDTIKPLLDLRDFLLDAQRLWQEQESLRVRSVRAKRISEIAARVFKYTEDSRREEVQTLFDQIGSDIDRLYARVSHDENRGGTRLRVRDVGAFSVNLRHRFYDHEDEDPRAYSNEGDLDISGLCAFLALRRWYRNQYPSFDLLILDDVLTSIDAEHRVRFTEVLLSEFKDYQILLTTHDRIWFEHLRDIQTSCGVTQQFISKTIHGWTIEEGPDLREPQEERERLVQLMGTGEPSQIAGEAGRLLEHILQEMRYNLPLGVQARRGERYGIGDLWPAYYSNIRKDYPGFYNKAQSTLEALDVRWPLRNWLGAHFNDWAKGVTRKEAEEFGKAVMDLFDMSFCTQCRRFIQPSITPKGQMACRCGNLIYSSLGKEAKPPKEIDDILKLTLGALRDTQLTGDKYLEWKRTEIGAEN